MPNRANKKFIVPIIEYISHIHYVYNRFWLRVVMRKKFQDFSYSIGIVRIIYPKIYYSNPQMITYRVSGDYKTHLLCRFIILHN